MKNRGSLWVGVAVFLKVSQSCQARLRPRRWGGSHNNTVASPTCAPIPVTFYIPYGDVVCVADVLHCRPGLPWG